MVPTQSWEEFEAVLATLLRRPKSATNLILAAAFCRAKKLATEFPKFCRNLPRIRGPGNPERVFRESLGAFRPRGTTNVRNSLYHPSEVNKRGRPSKWPPECLPSKFADFECAFSLKFLGENMTPKDPLFGGDFLGQILAADSLPGAFVHSRILFKIVTRIKLLFSNSLGRCSCSFRERREVISVTVTVLAVWRECFLHSYSSSPLGAGPCTSCLSVWPCSCVLVFIAQPSQSKVSCVLLGTSVRSCSKPSCLSQILDIL